eukprot:CAMPEP_0194210332 /NCGR_PEP_ID=MMETSP0156-20130528/8162_1 /TAXON_ID=33649 /ORGANISM="Thalassionema nitzschioides, Strain L26-B" /LENGTH=340 /DNA_ID=CAMNT_0038937661 /DNA_START=51 /DNA_END=1070 /DNA_ORIENTATION=-
MVQEKDKHGYTVTYDSTSHWGVIFQSWGSIWPKVLPYCVLNVIVTIATRVIQNNLDVDISISDQNLSFLNLAIAFLVVSRVNMAVARYNKALADLQVMFRESIEIMQKAVAFTFTNTDESAKEWRNELAYQTCMILRVAMAVIDYPEQQQNVWDLEELEESQRKEMKEYLYQETGTETNALRWASGIRSESLENMRVPIRLGYKLRKYVYSQKLCNSEPMDQIKEMKIIGSVDAFMGGFYGIITFLTTPFPFPVVQMARTFLFFYVFTVPFDLLTDKSGLVAHCIIIFILTFGFMGLEFVSIELNNPFGDDANDYDNLGFAYTCMEDIQCAILDVDGHEW